LVGFSKLLSVGDLRSDGFANEVARIVCERPELLPELIETLGSSNPSVRGHAADALEKVSRTHPEPVASFLPAITRQARNDEVAMVRWHLAMVLGHLAVVPATVPTSRRTLLSLLHDTSPFVRSWAITSLCIIARTSAQDAPAITRELAALVSDNSVAVAKRALTAVRALTDPHSRLPPSWVKSERVRDL
jgi:HEAT repeat protein